MWKSISIINKENEIVLDIRNKYLRFLSTKFETIYINFIEGGQGGWGTGRRVGGGGGGGGGGRGGVGGRGGGEV